MSTETVIALMAACTSLLVATVSILAAIITGMQARRTAENVENLKFRYSIDENTQGLRDANFQQSMAALQKIIQSIQKLKDHLQIILYDDSLSPSRIEEIISTCRAELLSTYEEYLVYYSQQDAKLGHSAKNIVLTIENIVKKVRKDDPFQGIATDSFENLLELRNELTDIQNLLRDSMMQKLSDRLGRAGTGNAS